jgi:hypothetical protein
VIKLEAERDILKKAAAYARGVSRDGFYAWLTRSRSRRSRSNEELGAKVRASFIASDRTYGARRRKSPY